MRILCLGLLAALSWVPGAVAADTEPSGKLSASVGAELIRLGQSGTTVNYIAHGYAAGPVTKASDPNKPFMVKGDFAFRVKELCLESAQAQLSPLGIFSADAAAGAPDADPAVFLTEVKTEVTEQDKITCTFVVKVSYAMRMTGNSRLTQLGYTIYMTGNVRSPDSKPAVLPATPL